MLKFYVRHGIIVEKIHGSISIKQSEWLEIYISFSTQKRKKAKIEFENHFYKLLNNEAPIEENFVTKYDYDKSDRIEYFFCVI